MITKEALKKDLTSVKQKIGHIPSSYSYLQHGKYHKSTLARQFGSWNNALLETFGDVVKTTPKRKNTRSCLNCNSLTKNPKFCSQNCAATYNNKQRGLHSPKTCLMCSKPIHYSSKMCSKCYSISRAKQGGHKTLSEFKKISASKNRYQGVRNHAHLIVKINNLKTNKCLFCSYSNHLDLCHIKDIGSFKDDTKLKIINDPSNLVFLCPNHHWDLDHNKLSTKEKQQLKNYKNGADREN